MIDNFDDRLNQLEARLSLLESRLIPKPPPLIPKEIEIKPSPLSLWLKENWLMLIGILLVILAGSWFISYAFSNNWIGETARVLLSLSAGAAIYIYGFITIKNRGENWILLGNAIILLSLYAGYQFYAIIPATSTFLLLYATLTITTIIALIFNLEGLGFASIITAMFIPDIIPSDLFYPFKLNFVLLINLAALFMFLIRGFGRVFHAAWLATLYHSFFSLSSAPNLFSALFYLLFYIPSVCSACGLIDKKLPKNGAIILFTSTMALIAWVSGNAPTHLGIAYYSFAALLSFYFGYLFAKNPFHHHIGIILGFNVMTFLLMAISLTTWPFIMGSLIQTVLALFIARFLLQAPEAIIRLPFFFLLPLVLIANNFSNYFYIPIYTLEFATLCTAAASFSLAGWIVKSTTVSKFRGRILGSLGVLTILFSMALIWNICHQALASQSMARGTALVIYIVTAEVLIYVGNTQLRLGGFAMILFVLFRLFIFDGWEMPIVIRTITFVATGLLLIGTAWFDKRSIKVTLSS